MWLWGEFCSVMSDNYSWRKRYQRGYGEESASPLLKEYLDNIRSEREMSEEEHDDYQHKYVGYVLL